jgi:hypothetical protein
MPLNKKEHQGVAKRKMCPLLLRVGVLKGAIIPLITKTILDL